MQISAKEAEVLIDFLDRVPIKGHQERTNMNILVLKIVEGGKENQEVT